MIWAQPKSIFNKHTAKINIHLTLTDLAPGLNEISSLLYVEYTPTSYCFHQYHWLHALTISWISVPVILWFVPLYVLNPWASMTPHCLHFMYVSIIICLLLASTSTNFLLTKKLHVRYPWLENYQNAFSTEHITKSTYIQHWGNELLAWMTFHLYRIRSTLLLVHYCHQYHWLHALTVSLIFVQVPAIVSFASVYVLNL